MTKWIRAVWLLLPHAPYLLKTIIWPPKTYPYGWELAKSRIIDVLEGPSSFSRVHVPLFTNDNVLWMNIRPLDYYKQAISDDEIWLCVR